MPPRGALPCAATPLAQCVTAHQKMWTSRNVSKAPPA
jgi:hypothetical protein